MATIDALELIDRDWEETEPLLSVQTLASLARLQWEEPTSSDGLAESVLTRLLADLPPDHAVWLVLRSADTRFEERRLHLEPQVLAERCVVRSLVALAEPDVTMRAVADYVEQEALAQVRREGVVFFISQDGTPSITARPFISDAEGGTPRFMFSSIESGTIHEIVRGFHERLGGYQDPAGAASWWLTPNQWLSKARPADLLGTGRDDELLFAVDQLANDSW